MKKAKQTSGGARMIASGKHPVLLGPTAAEWEIFSKAAEIEKRPITQFLIYHGLMAAEKIIEENRHKTIKYA